MQSLRRNNIVAFATVKYSLRSCEIVLAYSEIAL